MKEIGKILGSEARVKIMRLFLFHEDTSFDIVEVSRRTRVTPALARKELNLLQSTRFLRKKDFIKEQHIDPLDKVSKKTTKKVPGWILNSKFPLVRPFKKLLLDPDFIQTGEIPGRFRGSGTIKLMVVSGLFMNDDDRKLDILIVGDKLRKGRIDQIIKILESEIGKELRYATFESEEFKYRMDMYDKLLRDVFDYNHMKLLNKIKL